jgi:hypothetical protein
MTGTVRTGGYKALMMPRCALAGIALVVGARVARSQATPRVVPGARVYADIDRLASVGLIDIAGFGARPFSRREIVRLLTEARSNLSRNDRARSWAEDVIAADLARYEPHDSRPFDAAGAEVAYLDSPYRRIPADSNGGIDATVNPLASYRGGRPIANGATSTLETMHSASLGSRLAVSFNPRFTAAGERGGASNQNLRVQSGGANLLFGNLAIDVGREYAVFSQSPTGGLLLSENAPTLDMIRLSTDRPAGLPWLFRYLGPLQATVLVADLGAIDQIHAHSKLVAYRVEAHPHRFFEFGVEVIDEMGGNGAPPASFPDRAADAFPIIDVVFRPNSDFQFSNKLAGVDFNLRAPSLAGLDVYAEGVVDDFDTRRFHSTIFQDGGGIAGISLACIVQCGRLGVRAEYHQTGIRFYTHTDFSSGVQDNGVILGDPLGPRGLGGYLTIDGEASRVGMFALTGAYEVRSGNRYASTVADAHGGGFRFVQIEHHPGEHRARAMATWIPTSRNARVTLQASLGVERVTNFDFVEGRGRTNALAQLGYVWRP